VVCVDPVHQCDGLSSYFVYVLKALLVMLVPAVEPSRYTPLPTMLCCCCDSQHEQCRPHAIQFMKDTHIEECGCETVPLTWLLKKGPCTSLITSLTTCSAAFWTPSGMSKAGFTLAHCWTHIVHTRQH
jgi:hypothetical protein